MLPLLWDVKMVTCGLQSDPVCSVWRNVQLEYPSHEDSLGYSA